MRLISPNYKKLIFSIKIMSKKSVEYIVQIKLKDL